MIAQSVKYFVVALVGLLIDFAILFALVDFLGLNYLVSAAVSFLVALVVNFVLSERFVFRDPKISNSLNRFVLFGMIGLLGLGILTVSMWLMVDGLGLQYLLAKVLATVLVYVWNFLARKAMYRA